MAQKSVSTLLAERQSKFIETRTIIESEVNKFLKSLEALDPDIQETLRVPKDVTARDLLPELWAEEFRPDVYQQQLTSLNNYIEQVRAYSDKLTQEAIECLQQ